MSKLWRVQRFDRRRSSCAAKYPSRRPLQKIDRLDRLACSFGLFGRALGQGVVFVGVAVNQDESILPPLGAAQINMVERTVYQCLLDMPGNLARRVLNMVVQPVGFVCAVYQRRRINVRLPAEFQGLSDMLQLLLDRKPAVRNSSTKLFDNQHPRFGSAPISLA